MPRREPLRKKRKKHKLSNKLIYGIVAVILIFVVFLAYSSLRPDTSSRVRKAALIDHLSFSNPPANETFNDECKRILEDAGFNFTYHDGEEVTVDFYRNLPNYDYNLLVLRVHSAVIKQENGSLTNLIGFFTSEVYNESIISSEYLSELQNGRLALSRLFTGNDTYYFGITPFFVQSSIEGTFENTAIIMMGCEGLNHTSMAEALVQRGASVYISWTCLVTLDHTDHAIIRLLQDLLEKNHTIKTAVEMANPDPFYEGKLDYYPRKIENMTIQDLI